MKKYLIITSILFFFSNYFIKSQNSTTGLSRIYEITDSVSAENIKEKQKPLIGLSASNSNGASRLSGAYIEALIAAGATPVIVPVTTDAKTLLNIVKTLDGLVFTGGGDVNPPFFGETPIPNSLDVDTLRDDYELKLLKFASDRNIPILGICRGEQLINVAFGGTLYQDIPTQYEKTNILHNQNQPRKQATHTVDITPNSKLASILGKTKAVPVNSIHHQSVNTVAPGFKVVAVAPDGIVEAIEAYPNRRILAVQWHPEALLAGGNKDMLKIFDFIVKEADLYRQAKELHKSILSVDSHTDTPLSFKKQNFNIAKRDSNQVNLPKMSEGMLDGAFFAAYIRQGKRDKVSSDAAVKIVGSLIDNIHRQVKMNSKLCSIASTPEDFLKLKDEGKKAIFIGIENGYGIGKDLGNLEIFKSFGVTYMTLCHTTDNDICDTSSKTKNEWGGLSPFGEKVIKEMNRLGMMIDVSHAGESTFRDVIKLSKKPIIASHSAARALYDHDRNLTDEQLRILRDNGGVVQVCLVDMFINKNRKAASLDDVMNHIDHIVEIAGIDHIGIGSDFDGGGGVIGCQGANDLINITMKLIERGYSKDDIAKIWGGNFLRVMTKVQN